MSGPASLPAEVECWPDDPYELLGLSRRAAPQEVRSAHDRLAASFDPARAPEQCRRLRAARDAVLRDLERLLLLETPLTLELGPDPEPAPPRPETPPEDLDLSEATVAPPDAIAPRPLPSGRSPAIAAWQAALAGREAEAYRSLVDLAGQGATEDVCLRLYWLLTARPELDRERAPDDWLVRGLSAGGLAGPLWELYRRALAGEAEEALSPRCARLFDAAAEPDTLVELGRLRWLAAARAQRWDVPAADLQRLRACLPPSERVAWARAWSAAYDHLAWADAPAAVTLAGQCLYSLRSLQSVAPEVEELQQRGVRLRDLAAGWRRLRPEPEVPPPLLALVPLSWSRPFAEVRPRLLAFLATAVQLPRQFLVVLDTTYDHPAVLAEFGRMLEHLQQTLPQPPLEARSSSDLAELAFAFLDTADRSTYRNLRPSLLDFCLREAIAPETVAELAAENHYYWLAPDRHLSEALANDEPLRLVYLAHQLFWA
jgi:hypothetical protein